MPHPVEPAASRFVFDLVGAEPGADLVGAGADLEPSTLLQAYRTGLFPMGLGRRGSGTLGWWSPDPRGVLLPGGLRVSRSLRRSMRRFDIRLDTAFDAVVAACGDPSRPGAWITPQIAAAYARLHSLGWAHSVECWTDDRLVGGLYGVAVGGLFAGESMFHTERDASKAALVGLAEMLWADDDPRRLVDVQWRTEHLATLGIVEIARADYLRRLPAALAAPLPAAFTDRAGPPPRSTDLGP